MRFSLLPSQYPEYCAIRARNREAALIWQAGHAAFALVPLSIFAAVIVFIMAQVDPEVARDRSPWPVIAAFLFWATLCVILGIVLRRFAVKKGGEQNGA